MLPKTERLRRSSVFQRAYSGRKCVVTDLFSLYVLSRTAGKRGTPGKGSPEAPVILSADKTGKAPARAPRTPLVGFVASKKACKSACDRNLVKRRAREAYRLIRTNLHQMTEDSKENLYDVRESLPGWYALVWVLNENALNAPWQEIYKTMEECLLEAAHKFGKRSRKTENTDLSR